MELHNSPGERALLGLLLVAVMWALVQTLRLVVRQRRLRERLASARVKGAEGELRAEAILQRRGFRILRRQAVVRYPLGVDGVAVQVELRADFLVEDRGGRYVAEVKTGTFAPRLETAATRRQLLEYRVAFDVDGVLLVDADAATVRRVEFPLAGRAGAPTTSRLVWLVWLVTGLVLGVLGALGAPEAWAALSAYRP